MIEEIKIDGVLYEVVDNPNKNTISCNNCDLIRFCNKHDKFIEVCAKLNNEDYIFKKKYLV